MAEIKQGLRRSPALMSRFDTALLVVDVQEKLLNLMDRREVVVWNIRRLVETTGILEMPMFCTEQYPKGLGATVSELAPLLRERTSKTSFSCCGEPGFLEQVRAGDRPKILVVGIETHVCVQQTVYDLMSEGFHVYVPIDAVASRFKEDYKWALRRMDSAGATITTTESVIFEWCETAAASEFKEISRLAKESRPEMPS